MQWAPLLSALATVQHRHCCNIKNMFLQSQDCATDLFAPQMHHFWGTILPWARQRGAGTL